MGLSKTQLIRQVEQELATHEQAQRAPRVLWAQLGESVEAFAARCSRFVSAGSRILAAVPYGFAVPDGVQAVEFAEKYFSLLHPSHPSRYRIASGGRGSGKSRAVATAVVLLCLSARHRVLCVRETMRSLRESASHLLADTIRALRLEMWFEIHESELTCRATGAEIIFGGAGTSVDSLLSLERVTRVWAEQAEAISQRSFEVLIPTIREPGSEVLMTLNPDSDKAPVMQLIDSGRPDVRHVHTSWVDNPWWPRELENERVQMLRTDPDRHAHIYAGQCNTISEALVFRGKFAVEAFEPVHYPPERPRKQGEPAPYHGPFIGCDFGYAVDPSVLVRCWISTPENNSSGRGPPKGPRTLWIDREAYGIGVSLDALPALFDQIEGARRYKIRADSSRPETINHLQQRGYRGMTSVRKGKGSVEDGIEYMRSFERIVIHPRCERTIEEFQRFSYKVDRLTGDVLPDLKPGFDHAIDALRYALEPAIRASYGARVTELRM